MPNTINWQAPEFTYFEKSKSWFLISGLITAALFAWAIFSKNMLFALLIALGYFSLTAFAFKKPKLINLTISSHGIKINDALYSFDNLKSFWIFYNPPGVKEISLRSKKTIMPYIKIPLGNKNPAEIRQFLIKYIPEKRHPESLLDNLAKSLKL